MFTCNKIYKQGGGSGEGWCHKLRSEVGFHVEGNSSFSDGLGGKPGRFTSWPSCSHDSVTPITSMWLRLARLLSSSSLKPFFNISVLFTLSLMIRKHNNLQYFISEDLSAKRLLALKIANSEL